MRGLGEKEDIAAAVVYPCPTVAAGAADEIINGAGRM
jgi:hypothetical protein